MEEQNPYSAPQAAVETAPAPDELRIGGRGERLWAVIVDGLLSGSVFLG